MKKGLKGLFVLMIIVVVALVVALNVNMVSMNAVVSLLGAGNNATGTANGNFQNLSSSKGTFLLNVSFIANGTTNSTLTNVTLMFSNITDAYMYNTTIFNTSANQTYFQNTSFDIGLLADGVYNLSVNYTNSSSDSGQNISSAFSGNNITIDNTRPNITINLSSAASGIPVLDGSNFSASKLNVSFNASVFDFRPVSANDGLYSQNLFNISTVFLQFSNGTGSEFNVTADNRSGIWVVNYNVSSLAERKVSVRVYANDTFNNTNATTTINFTVDRTFPNVTLNTSSTPAGIPLEVGSNFSASKYNVSFNASVFDNVTGIYIVYFWFDNGTGNDFNITATNVSGEWTANYNVSSLFEGKQGVRVVANDSAGNINESFFFQFNHYRNRSGDGITCSKQYFN